MSAQIFNVFLNGLKNCGNTAATVKNGAGRVNRTCRKFGLARAPPIASDKRGGKMTFIRTLGFPARRPILLALAAAHLSCASAEDSKLDKILSDLQQTLESSPGKTPAPPPAENRTPAPQQSRSPKDGGSPSIPDSFKNFIEAMWQHQISNNPDDWASDFAASVNYGYASSGSASRTFIRNDRAKLINRYPVRSYTMLGIDIPRSSEDRISGVWKFRYAFKGTKTASGQAAVRFTAERQGGRWQFVSYSEEVVRN